MTVGFTGTRMGMTLHQKSEFVKLIQSVPITKFVHGGCRGADEQARDLILMHCPYVELICLPGDESQLEANMGILRQRVHRPKPYLSRNKEIVDSCDLLIASPLASIEQLRSGTWSTIRYARKFHKKHTILLPE